MLSQQEDRTFLIWSIIWLVWAVGFIYLGTVGFVYVSTVVGVMSFLFLWYRFCDALHAQQHISECQGVDDGHLSH